MQNIKITGMDIIENPKLTSSNNMILAYFGANIGPFRCKGCSLIRTARQGIAAYMPRLDHPNQHNQRFVSLHCEPTRNALLKAALEMYLLMGGKHAEWRPREPDQDGGDDLHPYRGSDAQGYPTHPLHPNFEARQDGEGTPTTQSEADLRKFYEIMVEDESAPSASRNRPPAIAVPDKPKALIRAVSPPLPDRLPVEVLPPSLGTSASKSTDGGAKC